MEKTRRYLSRLLTHPFLFLVYGISYWFPRNKKVWVFGIPHKFMWNSKYLFLYVQARKELGIQTVWISRDRKFIGELRKQGLSAFFWLSWQGIWYPLRAGLFIYDASVETINYWLSGGAKKVIFWHGIPLKKVERDVTKGKWTEVLLFNSQGLAKLAMRFLFPWRFVKPDVVLSNSEFFRTIYASAFQIAKERIVTTGFPKNDIYFKDIIGVEIGTDAKTLSNLRSIKAKNPACRVIFYSGTWRDTGGEFFTEKIDELKKVNTFCRERNLFFFTKLHPLAQNTTLSNVELAELERIVFIQTNSDLDPFLRYFDILVTDYSGIYFEFLLLDRPMVFFPFDYEKYVTRDRELYFEYDEITPGPKVRTLEELLAAIKDIVQGKDEYQEQRKRVRDLAYTHQDGNASMRVAAFLRNMSLES